MSTDRSQVEAEVIRGVIAKLIDDTAKINRQNQWCQAALASIITLAIVAVAKMFQ